MPNAPLAKHFDEGRSWLVCGGDRLVEAGEAAKAVYRIKAGRLATVEATQEGFVRILQFHRPGAVIGCAELLTGEPHPKTLMALRDTEIQSLDHETVKPLLETDATLLGDIARASLSLRRDPRAVNTQAAAILGFVAVCDSVAMRDFVERLAGRMRLAGASVVVLGSDGVRCSSTELSALEDANDYVLMAAEREDLDFARFSGRQIDRLILVGSAHSPLPDGVERFAAVAIQRHRLLDLVLIQPEETRRPAGSARWQGAAPTARLFHIRKDNTVDLDRFSRAFTGRSVGLALSGGGARAYAHIGVIRAFNELRVPIDFISGTSMGAVIAAGVAMGWGDEELDRRIQGAFVSSNPLGDIAFPLLAMTRGREVERRLDEHFGDVDIADLWRPFTCVSTDLTSGDLCAHRSGLVRDALRASISLPGVLPPVVTKGHVLVDGALVRNLPSDLVRDLHHGLTVGVDVAHVSGLMPEELMLRPAGWRWFASGAWLKGPPIVSVLIRSATMPTAKAMAGSRNDLDLLITPDLAGVELRDWKAYEPAVRAGYIAAMAQAPALLPHAA